MNKPIFSLLCGFLSVAMCVAQSQFSITHGPYLQALHETGVTIVWTTDKDAIGWVELAPDDSTHFYQKERPKYFASSHGFKDVSKLHKVTLRGLQPGVTYRYRVYAQEVTSHVGTNVKYGDVAATQVYRRAPLTFTTSRPDQTKLSFAVINDIHGRNDVMKNLLGQLDWPEIDLVFFNGDMANDLRSEAQLFAHYMDTATALFASEIPMYYARGNHETRGNFASAFPDYFPTTSGHLYYLFRRGPVCFVVLDCGEDKPDSDIEYSGIVNMDAYRTQQAEWLKEALERPEYQEAPYKVVICHMPPFGGWHGEEEIAEKFVPLLNAAGAQVMLSGHLHRHIKREAQPGAHRFPILVNSNNNMLRASADGQRLRVDVVDQSGKTVDSITLNPSR
ncbi:metallophosphoesterase [Parapedobacter sp. GCM10030251]|uniref:metallophosphoesterase n=1 Tax=Parapedobacter sp. GCM10030251 TaxID=3273419 RepID=UPI00360B2A11